MCMCAQLCIYAYKLTTASVSITVMHKHSFFIHSRETRKCTRKKQINTQAGTAKQQKRCSNICHRIKYEMTVIDRTNTKCTVYVYTLKIWAIDQQIASHSTFSTDTNHKRAFCIVHIQMNENYYAIHKTKQ